MGLLTEKYKAWAKYPEKYTTRQVLNQTVADLDRLDEVLESIKLLRDDLQKEKNNLSIEKITRYDFKGSIMSRDEIRKAKLIIFIDDGQIKELKNRYAVW